MTTQPPTRRLLHWAALVASGVVAGAIALTVTLVSTISHSEAATTPTTPSTSTTSTTSDDTSKNSSTGDTGLSSGDQAQSQAPVGGSNGS